MLHGLPGEDAGIAAMPFQWIGHTARMLQRDGFDVRGPLADAGVGGGDDGLLDDQATVDPAAYLLMCGLIINAADDEMHAAARSRMIRGSANIVVKAMAASRSLQDAIETAVRFFVIAGSYCRIELTVAGEEASILIRADSPDPKAQQVVEEMFATFLHIQMSHILGFLLPVTRFGALAADHPLAGRLHPYFLCPVTRANTTAMTFPAAYLAFPSRARVGANPLLEGELAWIARHAEARSGEFLGEDADTLSGEVFRRLLGGDLSFEDCSSALLLTPAELRRGLWLEGASFRRMRRAALIARARPHLVSGRGVDDIADALGYSDGRSFRRALKAATGLGVRDLRDMATPAHGGAPPAVLQRLRDEKRLQV